MPPMSPENVRSILEANCNITCLALVPVGGEQATKSVATAGGDSSQGDVGVAVWDEEVHADVENADNVFDQGVGDSSEGMEPEVMICTIQMNC